MIPFLYDKYLHDKNKNFCPNQRSFDTFFLLWHVVLLDEADEEYVDSGVKKIEKKMLKERRKQRKYKNIDIVSLLPGIDFDDNDDLSMLHNSQKGRN